MKSHSRDSATPTPGLSSISSHKKKHRRHKHEQPELSSPVPRELEARADVDVKSEREARKLEKKERKEKRKAKRLAKDKAKEAEKEAREVEVPGDTPSLDLSLDAVQERAFESFKALMAAERAAKAARSSARTPKSKAGPDPPASNSSPANATTSVEKKRSRSVKDHDDMARSDDSTVVDQGADELPAKKRKVDKEQRKLEKEKRKADKKKRKEAKSEGKSDRPVANVRRYARAYLEPKKGLWSDLELEAFDSAMAECGTDFVVVAALVAAAVGSMKSPADCLGRWQYDRTGLSAKPRSAPSLALDPLEAETTEQQISDAAESPPSPESEYSDDEELIAEIARAMAQADSDAARDVEKTRQYLAGNDSFKEALVSLDGTIDSLQSNESEFQRNEAERRWRYEGGAVPTG
ncbi:hypothetical protein RQP46_008993 [Phenoliferia psychrophenolica]